MGLFTFITGVLSAIAITAEFAMRGGEEPTAVTVCLIFILAVSIVGHIFSSEDIF